MKSKEQTAPGFSCLLRVPLEPGRTVVMSGPTQEFYLHRVPKVTKTDRNGEEGIRVNITMRTVHPGLLALSTHTHIHSLTLKFTHTFLSRSVSLIDHDLLFSLDSATNFMKELREKGDKEGEVSNNYKYLLERYNVTRLKDANTSAQSFGEIKGAPEVRLHPETTPTHQSLPPTNHTPISFCLSLLHNSREPAT
jgi:hypothetical protein